MKLKITIIILIIYSFDLMAQVLETNENSIKPSIPKGYRSIKLNMNKEQVISQLKKESIFDTSDQEKLTFRNEPDKEILKTNGVNFIKMAYFHFHNNVLYQITLDIDQNKLSYNDILMTLQNKYGKPINFSPGTADWENDAVKLSLQRPVMIKYYSIKIIKEILDETKEPLNFYKISREKFLNSL